MLSGGECFGVSDRCGHWGFCVECASRYWQLTLRNGDGIGGRVEEDHRRERSRVFPEDLLSPLGMG